MAETIQREQNPAPRKKRRRSLIRYLAVLLALGLLVAVGTRLKSWQEQRQESRTVVLVNPWNYLDETKYKARLVSVDEGMKLDRSCAPKLKNMLADCAAAGYDPQLLSAYRSREEQEELFSRQVRQLIEGGADAEQAEDLAAETVARPGTSEHELGLAVDIVDRKNPVTDESQAGTGTQQWLRENAWRYGFILRYPENASEITGAPYEPWHYRYVGEATAWQVYSLGITLEEYSSMFYSEEAEIVFDEAE